MRVTALRITQRVEFGAYCLNLLLRGGRVFPNLLRGPSTRRSGGRRRRRRLGSRSVNGRNLPTDTLLTIVWRRRTRYSGSVRLDRHKPDSPRDHHHSGEIPAGYLCGPGAWNLESQGCGCQGVLSDLTIHWVGLGSIAWRKNTSSIKLSVIAVHLPRGHDGFQRERGLLESRV